MKPLLPWLLLLAACAGFGAETPKQIRDSVPCGSADWTLKIHCSKPPAGGTCLKHCHGARSYHSANLGRKE